jgi:hypothetical protein
MTHNLTGRLMIKNHARRLFGVGSGDGLAIDTHGIIGAHALTDMSRLAIDRDATSDDELFHLAS